MSSEEYRAVLYRDAQSLPFAAVEAPTAGATNPIIRLITSGHPVTNMSIQEAQNLIKHLTEAVDTAQPTTHEQQMEEVGVRG